MLTFEFRAFRITSSIFWNSWPNKILCISMKSLKYSIKLQLFTIFAFLWPSQVLNYSNCSEWKAERGTLGKFERIQLLKLKSGHDRMTNTAELTSSIMGVYNAPIGKCTVIRMLLRTTAGNEWCDVIINYPGPVNAHAGFHWRLTNTFTFTVTNTATSHKYSPTIFQVHNSLTMTQKISDWQLTQLIMLVNTNK